MCCDFKYYARLWKKQAVERKIIEDEAKNILEKENKEKHLKFIHKLTDNGEMVLQCIEEYKIESKCSHCGKNIIICK